MVNSIDKNANFNGVTNIDKGDICVSSKQKEKSYTKQSWKNEKTISVSYTQQVLSKFCMLDCNTVQTIMAENLKIEKDTENKLTKKPYRQLIDCLSYIAGMTRSDINYAINWLSKFQDCATDKMYEHAKRILRYLEGTILIWSYVIVVAINLEW